MNRTNRCILVHCHTARRAAEYDVEQLIGDFNPRDKRIVYVGDDEGVQRTCGMSRDTPWAIIGGIGAKAYHILRARFGDPVSVEAALNNIDFAYGVAHGA